MDLSDRLAIGHQPSDMFKKCSFGSQGDESIDCKRLISANSQPIFSDNYGVCYVFNFGVNGSAITFNPGRQYGLKLLIDIEGE